MLVVTYGQDGNCLSCHCKKDMLLERNQKPKNKNKREHAHETV